MSFEAPTIPPNAYPTTKSAAVVLKASPVVLHAAPPSELDSQVEEPMDYTPISNLAAPDYPPEEWPEGPGPLGF